MSKTKKAKTEKVEVKVPPKAEKPIGADDVRRIVRETVDDSLEEYRRTGYIECPTDKILCKIKDGKAICPVCKAKFDGDHWNPAKNEKSEDPKLPKEPEKPGNKPWEYRLKYD